MRFLLPTMLAAALTLPVGAAAETREPPRKQAPERVRADLSLHVSGHNVLAGHELVVSGRVSPSPGRAHRVKILVDGPSGGQMRTTTDRNGRFRARWGLHETGIYAVRAYGIHDRRVSGSRSATRRVTVYRPAAAS